jgi:hypothetical protein
MLLLHCFLLVEGRVAVISLCLLSFSGFRTGLQEEEEEEEAGS